MKTFSSSSQSELRSMSHHTLEMQLPLPVEAWSIDDDWNNVQEREQRKKIQNRLNQRAYRKRNAPKNPSKQRPFRVERFRVKEIPPAQDKDLPCQRGLESSIDLDCLSKDPDHSEEAASLVQVNQPKTSLALCPVEEHFSQSNIAVTDPSSELDDQWSLITPALQNGPWLMDDCIHSLDGSQLAAAVCKGCPPNDSQHHGQSIFIKSLKALNNPPTIKIDVANVSTATFPLSSDHLLHLIHYNVFRAVMNNKAVLYRTTTFFKVDASITIPESKNLCNGITVMRQKPGKVMPASLTPTHVQMNIAHSSWLNNIPFAAIRDNLIKAEKDFDHQDFCNDTFGELFTGGSPYTPQSSEPTDNISYNNWSELDDEITTQRKGFIVWGEPWDKNGWEVTPGFVRKWRWVLKGCPDIIVSSNRWRAKRDERPLVYPFSDDE